MCIRYILVVFDYFFEIPRKNMTYAAARGIIYLRVDMVSILYFCIYCQLVTSIENYSQNEISNS